MHLSKLQMRGFKTFADRTELEFGPGITAIVGPNGVGKSNIADAVLWALGEQSHKSLRTEGSQDVIFAGSEQRRPLGMAEVSLVIDNAEGLLPTEYSEVAISRRLFRTGESEYLLNRSTVRLRDIRELLVDTGLGSGAYSVVGQGEIEAVLSIRSEDRRELLEEVAGVRKYRMRRTEAERKLEQTEANITRVQDILYELSSQRQALAEQATVAREYKQLAEQLRELELHLLAAGHERRRGKREKADSDIAVAAADLQETRNKISALEAEYEKSSLQVAKLTDELDNLRDQAAMAERELNRRRGAEAVAAERLKAVRQRRGQLQNDMAQAQQHRQELVARQTSLEQEQQQYAKVLKRQQARTEELATAYEHQEEQYRQALQQRETMHERQTALSEQLARLENETATLQGLEEELGQRVARLTTQKEQLEQRRDQLQDTLRQTREQVDALRAQIHQAQQQLQAARLQHAQQMRTLREHRHKRDLLAGAVAAAESRQALLQELQEAHEGYEEGPRALLQASQKAQLAGIAGLVVDFLEVPRRLETAVEAGLSDRLQWVLVETDEQMRACLNHLEEHEAGRATILPTNPLPAGLGAPIPIAVGRGSGVVGAGSKVLRYPRRLAHVFEQLLGDIVFVADLDTAYRIRPRLTGSVRLVTLDGQVLGPRGEVTGGKVNKGVQATLQRRRQLQQLEEQLGQFRGYLAAMWQTEENLESHQQDLTEIVEERANQLTETEKEIGQVEGEIRHTADRLRAAAVALEEVDQEIDGLQERRQDAGSRTTQAERTMVGLRHELDELNGELAKLEAEGLRREELETQQEQVTVAKVELAQLGEKHHAAATMREQAQRELARIDEEIQRVGAEFQELEGAEQRALEASQSGNGEIEQLEQEAAALAEHSAHCREQLAELREATARLEVARRRLEGIREEQVQDVHRLDLVVAREESQLEQIVEELRDVYGLSPEEALAQRPVDFKRAQASSAAHQLREQIRSLGYVNVGAIEQCQRLQEREDFLSGQLADLHQAREDLFEVIAAIDEAAEELFLESFHQVAEAFAELFRRLFGGGSTRLELTDPDNPLVGGVDVIVQQPGRRQQNLLLLSGGEKALTAVALLFAMIKVKPSPFCVLDEIDAALDATNTDRFTEVLNDFARYTQFIIITHNPKTMEAADVLHGVTMQEPGVSKLISVELTEAQREAEEWATEQRPAGEQAAALPVRTD